MAPKTKKCLLVLFSSPTWHTERVSSGALFRVRVSCFQKLDAHDKRQARPWARAALAKLERPRAPYSLPAARMYHSRSSQINKNTLLVFLFTFFCPCVLFYTGRGLKQKQSHVDLAFNLCAWSAWACSAQDRGPKDTCGFHRCCASSPENLPAPAKIHCLVPRQIPLCKGSSCSLVNSSVGGSGIGESAHF